jgi:hypothetical protein
MNALNQLQALGLELTVIPPLFQDSDSDCIIGEQFSSPAEHRAAISEVQRFRGRVYVADGAIPANALDEEGRHFQQFDFENYHVCVRNSEGKIGGCIRIRLHEPTVEVRALRLHEVIERLPSDVAELCSGALTSLFRFSRREGVRIGEVGGWAIDEALRRCRVSMLLPIASWSLYQTIGNAIVFASATTRHQSSACLRRVGGFTLLHGGHELPPFRDDYHGCEMELLGFDSRRPHPKYEKLVAELKAFLLTKIHKTSVSQSHLQIENDFAPFPGRIDEEPAYA